MALVDKSVTTDFEVVNGCVGAYNRIVISKVFLEHKSVHNFIRFTRLVTLECLSEESVPNRKAWSSAPFDTGSESICEAELLIWLKVAVNVRSFHASKRSAFDFEGSFLCLRASHDERIHFCFLYSDRFVKSLLRIQRINLNSEAIVGVPDPGVVRTWLAGHVFTAGVPVGPLYFP